MRTAAGTSSAREVARRSTPRPRCVADRDLEVGRAVGPVDRAERQEGAAQPAPPAAVAGGRRPRRRPGRRRGSGRAGRRGRGWRGRRGRRHGGRPPRSARRRRAVSRRSPGAAAGSPVRLMPSSRAARQCGSGGQVRGQLGHHALGERAAAHRLSAGRAGGRRGGARPPRRRRRRARAASSTAITTERCRPPVQPDRDVHRRAAAPPRRRRSPSRAAPRCARGTPASPRLPSRNARTGSSRPGERPQLRLPERVGQDAAVHHPVGLERWAVLEAEGRDGAAEVACGLARPGRTTSRMRSASSASLSAPVSMTTSAAARSGASTARSARHRRLARRRPRRTGAAGCCPPGGAPARRRGRRGRPRERRRRPRARPARRRGGRRPPPPPAGRGGSAMNAASSGTGRLSTQLDPGGLERAQRGGLAGPAHPGEDPGFGACRSAAVLVTPQSVVSEARGPPAAGAAMS